MKHFTKGLAILVLCFAANVIWVLIIRQIFTHLDPIGQITSLKNEIFFACIFAPLWEETLFRYFPLSIVLALPQPWQNKLIIPVMAATSIIFGWMHGSPVNIMIQGFSGFMMATIFMTMRNNWWNITYHALWNLGCVLTAYYVS